MVLDAKGCLKMACSGAFWSIVLKLMYLQQKIPNQFESVKRVEKNEMFSLTMVGFGEFRVAF